MESRSRVSAISGAQVQSIVHKLKDCQVVLEFYFGEIPLVDIPNASTFSEERKKQPTGKHISQHSSLISHLQRYVNFSCDQRCCFIEFGSGVGRLSEQLQEETDAAHFHLMIDRQTFKSTRLRDRTMQTRFTACPAKHRMNCLTSPISRVTVDIADISLDKTLEAAFGDNQSLPVAISKHLCGKAFDM
jgi:hypothetical protein